MKSERELQQLDKFEKFLKSTNKSIAHIDYICMKSGLDGTQGEKEYAIVKYDNDYYDVFNVTCTSIQMIAFEILDYELNGNKRPLHPKMFMSEDQEYKIDGLCGRFYLIDKTNEYALFESAIYGDEVPCVLVRQGTEVQYRVYKHGEEEDQDYYRLVLPKIMGYVTETWDDIQTALEDCDLA